MAELPNEYHRVAVSKGLKYLQSEDDRQGRSDYWWPSVDDKRLIYSVDGQNAKVSGLYKKNGDKNTIADRSTYWRFDISIVEDTVLKRRLEECQLTKSREMYKDGGIDILRLSVDDFKQFLEEFIERNHPATYQ